MVEEWMPPLQLPLSRAEFARLPRNPAFAYNYLNGQAWINPRPRYYHAILSLPGLSLDGVASGTLRHIDDRDWDRLIELFAEAFAEHQPFAGQDRATRRIAAAEALERTRDGGDGPWVRRASWVVFDRQASLAGAIFVTLLPRLDPTDWDSYGWEHPPPPDCIERRLGRPHLTWIFVDPQRAGRGNGSALLQAAAGSLLDMGYDELLTTFMLGNESSMLWHWRCGFRLLCYPGSRRKQNGETA